MGDYTSLSVKGGTKERFKGAKPDSDTADEFLNTLLDEFTGDGDADPDALHSIGEDVTVILDLLRELDHDSTEVTVSEVTLDASERAKIAREVAEQLR